MIPSLRFLPVCSRQFLFGLILAAIVPGSHPLLAQNSTVAPMVRLVESGRLPESRLPTVLGLICKRGDATDLAFVFSQVTEKGKLTAATRLEALKLLAETSQNRSLQPDADLTQLGDVLKQAIAAEDVALQKQVIELIGVWQVKSLTDDLSALLKQGTTDELNGSILQTVARLGGEDAVPLIRELTGPEQKPALRVAAITGLASLDLSAAADAAAQFIAEAKNGNRFGPLLAPFLARQQGPELLGKALAAQSLEPDTAKLVLRAMLAAGRNDAPLSDPLSAAAGLDNSMEPLSPAEMQALVARVQQHGDPARGEQVFRRQELNCYKCHAIGKAGGNIGPDLGAIGGSSPIDYLINSLLLPSQAIKEAYKTVLIVDIDGLTHTGIVVDRDDDRVVLRDAQGKEVTVAEEDIEFEKEGDSLMPAGLTKFLTDQEFVDLLRYLAALGKDSGYIMPSTPTVYRWRVYNGSPAKVTGDLFDDDSVRNMLFEYAPEKWRPVYALASGELPMAEAKSIARSPVVFAYAEVDVTVAGGIALQLNAADGVIAWLDNARWSPEEWSGMAVTPGRHRLLFRIDTNRFSAPGLLTQLTKTETNAAEFTIVVGE